MSDPVICYVIVDAEGKILYVAETRQAANLIRNGNKSIKVRRATIRVFNA